MTSIEWLIDQLIPEDQHEGIMDIIEDAKDRHKQEIIDAYKVDVDEWPTQLSERAEQYYQEKFVSKGSDETKEESLVEKMIPHQLKYNLDVMEKLTKTSHKQEISDEEIEKAWGSIETKYVDKWVSFELMFKEGAKWYREQLKHKL
jgi:hypothetical protein